MRAWHKGVDEFVEAGADFDGSLVRVFSYQVIDQLLNDGGKQIIVPTFKRNIHVLDSDGHRIPGMSFPVKDGAYFHTSPVMVDFDQDGTDDFVWGECQLPPLRCVA